jgi:DNA-binding NarL/FixJ family response regulator
VRRTRATLIDVVECAYREARAGSEPWLSAVLSTLAPLLDTGLGMIGFDYDTSRPIDAWLSRPLVHGGDPELATGVLGSFSATPTSIRKQVYARVAPVSTLSDQLGMPMTSYRGTRHHARRLGVADLVKITATDGAGRGTCFCAPARSTRSPTERELLRWSVVTPHLAVARRLAGILPDAVLTPDGRLIDGSEEAVRQRELLGHAARRMERSRLARSRGDDEAVQAWSALVAGTWSLLEEVERDGRRVVLAIVRPSGTLDPRRLSTTERVIAERIARGDGNKLIAYDLGVSDGTVARHSHTIYRKLGVRNRAGLAARIALLRRGARNRYRLEDLEIEEMESGAPVSSAPLSPAERAVAAAASRGESTRTIAVARGVSERTVANQIAAIFAKLDVRSRSELAARLGGG